MQVSLGLARIDLQCHFDRFQLRGADAVRTGLVRDRDVPLLNRGLTDLQETAEHLIGRFVFGRRGEPGEHIPMAGAIADQRDGRLVEKDSFGHDLLLQQRQEAQDDVDFFGLEDDVGRVVVTIDTHIGEFEPDAGQDDQLDPIDLDLAPQTGFELLEEEILDDVDAEQLARIEEKERTHDHQAEQR